MKKSGFLKTAMVLSISFFSAGSVMAMDKEMSMKMPMTHKEMMQKPMGSMQHCNHMMMNDLGPADKTYDLRYINMMISHHEGAVKMSQDALTKSQRPEIKELAQNIITAQQQEIKQLKTWRMQWYSQ